MYAPAPVPPKPQIPALASNERTARMYVRHVAGSSMALFFAIMMTLVQLLNLYTVFNPLYALTAEELEAAGAVLDLQSFANMVTGISLVSTIPSILLLIGIWITVGKARSGPELQSAGGLRLINGTLKAMRIITPCLALVAGILIMALFAGIPELQL